VDSRRKYNEKEKSSWVEIMTSLMKEGKKSKPTWNQWKKTILYFPSASDVQPFIGKLTSICTSAHSLTFLFIARNR